MLTQIVYTSVAIPEIQNKDLYEILTTAVDKNGQHGITGFLVYNDGKFRQVIEGDDNDIQQLYKNIVEDERHTVCEKNIERQIIEREFPIWAMGFCPVKNSKISDFEKDNLAVFPTDMFDEVQHNVTSAVQLIKDFIKSGS